MADLSVVAVLTFLHIIAAMGWLGGAIYFLSTIGPGVRAFTPPASLEFMTKVSPRSTRFFAVASTATVIFGLALLLATFGTNYASWPGYIEVGLTLGLIAYLIAILVTVPAFLKADRIAHQIISNPQQGPPPPELIKTLRRGNLGALTVAIILMLALIFMVSSAVFA